jgi:alkylation response protein AidB-like acyl-CoA dehydrogenase
MPACISRQKPPIIHTNPDFGYSLTMLHESGVLRTSTTDLAKELAQNFAKRAAEADKKGELPLQDVQDLKASSYLGLPVPKEFGGWGASLQECVAAQLELAQGSGSTALVAVMTLHLTGYARETQPWSAEHYERLCREVAKGSLINAVASEPRLGSPSRGGLPDSFAEQQGDTLIINGHKTWVTGGKHLDHLLVRVRLNDEAVNIWIPGNTPGLHWENTWADSLSLRASDSHDLFLEHVCVPIENIIETSQTKPAPNIWFPMLIAATYLGVAFAARHEAIQYAKERVPTALAKPIATLPTIQRQIGEIDLALQTARVFLLQTASEWSGQNPENFHPKAVAAKHVAIETSLQVTDKALRLVGASGLSKDLNLERYFRDVRAGLMHPPSSEAGLELLGRTALGL